VNNNTMTYSTTGDFALPLSEVDGFIIGHPKDANGVQYELVGFKYPSTIGNTVDFPLTSTLTHDNFNNNDTDMSLIAVWQPMVVKVEFFSTSSDASPKTQWIPFDVDFTVHEDFPNDDENLIQKFIYNRTSDAWEDVSEEQPTYVHKQGIIEWNQYWSQSSEAERIVADGHIMRISRADFGPNELPYIKFDAVWGDAWDEVDFNVTTSNGTETYCTA